MGEGNPHPPRRGHHNEREGRMNPHYDTEKLGLESIEFDDPDAGYSFDTLLFVATKDGRVYSATDSGCSCPTPFESNEGPDMESVLQTMERIGSVEQAEQVFDSWNKSGYGKPFLPMSEKATASDWVRERLKQ